MYGVNKEGSKSLGQYHLTVFDYPDIVAGLRHQEKCMDSDSADHLWFLLRNAIQQIYRKRHSHLQFEELYRYGYGLVMYKKGELLYTGLHDVIAEHITNKVQSKVLANLNSNFLHTINNAWEEHKPAMDMIGDIFMYMDRVYVPQNKLDSVYTIGLNLFKELVVRNSRIQAFLQETLLEMVMKERQGELVDRSTFRSTTRMLMQLGNGSASIYQENFEQPFLEQTAIFYRTESKQLLEENNASLYVRRVENRISEEIERSEHCYDELTTPKIREVLQDELIKANMNIIVEMRDSGVMSMLQNRQAEDLACMYKLLSRVSGGLEAMFQNISRYLREQGLVLVTDNRNDNALHYVQELLNLIDKVDYYVVNSFSNDKAIKKLIGLDFEYILNLNSRSPEYLSIFFDDKLKKTVRGMTDDDKKVIEKSVCLFRFLQDKDLFEQYYKQHLARRLLASKYFNDENEQTVILKFKVECGLGYSRKMEGMFRDMWRSNSLTEEFRKHVAETLAPVHGVDLSVKVLTAVFWPTQNLPLPCNIPVAPLTAYETFKTFYLLRHCGRQLTLVPQLSSAELEAYFVQPHCEDWQTLPCGELRSYLLQVSTYQMCVLMLFNDRPRWYFQELQVETNISPRDLIRALQTLAVGKPTQRVLMKQPDSFKIEINDCFYVNSAFTSKTNRVKVLPFPARYEAELERQDTIKRVTEDRNHEVEAAIIRVMKARKVMNYDNLLTEVVTILTPRFIPTKDVVKTRIEVLIEREYISRNSEDRRIYKYIA